MGTVAAFCQIDSENQKVNNKFNGLESFQFGQEGSVYKAEAKESMADQRLA